MSGSADRGRTGGDLAQDAHAGGTTFGYAYNAAKRLTTVTQGASTSGVYAYDFAGEKVWQGLWPSGGAGS